MSTLISLDVLQYAAPVALAAVGETVNQKAGVINIGLEGTMLTSSFFAMLVSFSSGSPFLGVLAGILAALALVLLSSWFTIYLSGDQVVVGTAVNLLALGLTGSLFRAQFGQSGKLLSVPVLPKVGPLDLILILLLVSIPLVWWVLQRSSWGLAVRAAGEYPKSAEAAGFSVTRLRLQAGLVGGVFAGLAGSYLSLGIAGSFAENMTAGRGFVAIAMVTFGRWRPIWVVAAALLVGFADGLQYKFQSLGVQLPHQLFIAMPYLVALITLIVVGKGTVAPAALAQPYRTER